MISEKTLIGEVQGTLLTPARTTGLGVVVLTGSSGRVGARFAVRGKWHVSARADSNRCTPSITARTFQVLR